MTDNKEKKIVNTRYDFADLSKPLRSDFASDHALMNQASMTAQLYMVRARESIDSLFGKGYAKNHPELVAAFMHVSSTDFDTAMRIKYGVES